MPTIDPWNALRQWRKNWVLVCPCHENQEADTDVLEPHRAGMHEAAGYSLAGPCKRCFERRWFQNDRSYFQQSLNPLDSFAMRIPQPKTRNLLQVLKGYWPIVECVDCKPAPDWKTGDPLGLDDFLGLGLGDAPSARAARRPPNARKAPIKGRSATVGAVQLRRSHHLARYAQLATDDAWILDGSNLPWSRTFKDLRSAGILYAARKLEVRDLVLWTAGNAGLSLATAVRQFNEVHKSSYEVYCVLYAELAASVAERLRREGARIIGIATRGAVLTREQTIEVASALRERLRTHSAADVPRRHLARRVGADSLMLEVTDGWDGIGTFMYRMVVFNALRHLALTAKNDKDGPWIVIVPVGTGSLLLGARLAIDDFKNLQEGFPHQGVYLVGALPAGDDNVLRAMRLDPDWPIGEGWWRRPMHQAPWASPVGPQPAEAPKLVGVYSPLAAWINREHWVRDTLFIEVDRSSQLEAAARLLGRVGDETMTAEPSAWIAFGAVRGLQQWAEERRRRARSTGPKPLVLKEAKLLVINTGHGLLDEREEQFLSALRFG